MRRRTVNRPLPLGSPARTAICAPAGKTAGAGPHLKLEPEAAASDFWALAVAANNTSSAVDVRKRIRCLLDVSISCSGDPGDGEDTGDRSAALRAEYGEIQFVYGVSAARRPRRRSARGS